MRGTHHLKWQWSAKTTAEDKAWVKANGFRLFRFVGTKMQLISDILATLELYGDILIKSPTIPASVAAANAKFLKDYSNVLTLTSPPSSAYPVSVDHNGTSDCGPPCTRRVFLSRRRLVPLTSILGSRFVADFLGIMRMDGLGTMQVQ